MHRKLATIMVGDIVGSTRQMEADEEAAVQRFEACLTAVSRTICDHEGRVFNRAGDAVLAEFQSPVNALRAAMAARGSLARVPGISASDMRFGLHLADVVEMDGDLRGDGVNIAARIQCAADPGAIDASASVFDQVRRNSPCIFDDIGEKRFDGLSDPIRIFRVRDRMVPYRGQASEAAPPATVRVKRPQSIAVPPLSTASSANEDQRFLAEGLTEDLIQDLGRLKQLFVISHTASSGLAGRDPVTIGSELGVRYVLTGSVRATGSRLRLNLSLVETDQGRVLWSDRIQRPFDEFMDMMDDIVARVTGTVLGRVLNADTVSARSRPPSSLSAYEYYLRGLEHHHLGAVTDDNLREAMKWFERAIAADPNFARAHAMWVCSAARLPDYDWDFGRSRVTRALELDPNDPESNRIMGSILLQERKFDASRPYHRKALELAPSDAYIVGKCAGFHSFVGEPDRALELVGRAEQLDPFLPPWVTEGKMVALYGLERHADVLEAGRSQPYQTRRSRIYRAASRVALGDLDLARAIIAEAVADVPDLSQDYVRLNEPYRDDAVLNRLLKRLERAGLAAKV